MKRKSKKLRLDRTTLRRLDSKKLANVQGGYTNLTDELPSTSLIVCSNK